MMASSSPKFSPSVTAWPVGVREWLERFAQAVRESDFETGQALFLEETQSFGTRATSARNRRELMDLQWRVIWPNTEEFTFDLKESSANIRVSSGGDLCTVWLRWHSFAKPRLRGDIAKSGKFLRTGRCTVVLVRNEESGAGAAADGRGWRAAHSHFSMEPMDEDWERQLPPAT